jgi:hypothetical protein
MISGKLFPRLLLAFLLLSPLPLGMLAWLHVEAFERTLHDATLTNLESIADKKADQINTYLDERMANSQFLARSATLREALVSLSRPEALANPQAPSIRQLAQRFRDYYRILLDDLGYYDMLLTDAAGNVVFSVLQEPDLGTNLNSGPFRDSHLATAHHEAMSLLSTQTSMARPYAPSGDKPAIFIVAPLIEGGRVRQRSLATRLDKLTAVTNDITGLGNGETVLAQQEDGATLRAPAHLRMPLSAWCNWRNACPPRRWAEHGNGVTRLRQSSPRVMLSAAQRHGGEWIPPAFAPARLRAPPCWACWCCCCWPPAQRHCFSGAP